MARTKREAADKWTMTKATVSIDSLIPNPRNARIHPEIQLQRLAASLKTFGQPKPILVRAANRMIIAGHGVLEAAQLAGWKTIRAMLWDLPQREADAFMLGDNKHAMNGREDRARAASLMQEIDSDLWLAIGYSDEEAQAELGRLDSQRLSVSTIDVGEVLDDFWIVIRGPLVDQAVTLHRITEILGDLGNVEVTLGTENHG